MILVVPVLDSWKRVDLRVRAFNVPPQQVSFPHGVSGSSCQHGLKGVKPCGVSDVGGKSACFLFYKVGQALRICGRCDLNYRCLI